ncbi:MAG: M48 family metallopeptidase [Leptolyngbyaceae cyanobacterium MO_188.B28]|nr:M48 family metallopeptidase [Leptolyngbyaceae cyanobacterium MO_188.B28]
MSTFLHSVTQQIRRRWFYGLISLIFAIGVGVATPRPGQALSWVDLLFNGIQYVQLSNMSDRQEIELGGQINQQIVNNEFRLSRNSRVNNYVNDIGQRLAPASDRPNIPYHFQVVSDNQINAFATMGGYVYVTTGLIKEASNEAELAGVIGHEIGHIAGRHAVNQLRDATLAQGIAGALGVEQDVLVNLGVELALRLPASRGDEYNADERGFNNLGRAGYAQAGLVTFMQKLVGRGSTPTILSTHPAASDRVARLQTMLDSSASASANSGLDAAAYRTRINSL